MKQSLVLPFLVALLTACSHVPVSTGETQPSVMLVTAEYHTILETVTANGRIGAPAGAETKLSFQVPGVLQRVYVHIGDHVASGQALAQLDLTGLALSAQQAQSDAQAAAATAQQAAIDRTSTKIAVDKAALRRARALYAAGIAARKDIEAAQAQLAVDRADAQSNTAQLRSAEAQAASAVAKASLARRDLSLTTLRAPVDGIIVGILHREGESVDPTTPVIAIGPSTENSVTLTVAAGDAARIHPGDIAHLTIPGSPLHGEGVVTGVGTTLDPATQAATVVVKGIPRGSFAGSAVQATIEIARVHGIVIPQSAVIQDPQSGNMLVFVQTHGAHRTEQFAQRSVHVAFNNGNDVLITSGVRAGERIAAQGAFALLAPASSGN